jgi:hypothetical protein
MDLRKYYNTGVGMTKPSLIDIIDTLDSYDRPISILEFGSGFSTNFFIDYIKKRGDNSRIVSFDSDKRYSYKPKDGDTCLKMCIRELISCKDDDFDKCIQSGVFYKSVFSRHISLPTNHPKYWRQRNLFYDIQDDDISGVFDFILLDGPNGNGRNLSYCIIKNHIQSGSHIMIDDCNSRDGDYDYKFRENLESLYDVEKIKEHIYDKRSNVWENGGNYCLYKFN